MSSHHVVKENQEPALLILECISFSKIESLLEWSPLVMVADSVVEEVINWGIKIDVVLGGSNSQNLPEKLKDQAPVKILSHQETDIFDTLFNYLIANNHKAVHMTGSFSNERLQKLMLVANKVQITLLEESCRWLLIAQGSFKKWIPEGTALRVIKKHPEQEILVSGLTLNQGTGSITQEGFVAIKSKESFWVGEFF